MRDNDLPQWHHTEHAWHFNYSDKMNKEREREREKVSARVQFLEKQFTIYTEKMQNVHDSQNGTRLPEEWIFFSLFVRSSFIHFLSPVNLWNIPYAYGFFVWRNKKQYEIGQK